jgi:hypothetical protein
MLSRKYYNQLAAILRNNTDRDGNISAAALAHELADWLRAFNDRFDKARFIEACTHATESLDSSH